MTQPIRTGTVPPQAGYVEPEQVVRGGYRPDAAIHTVSDQVNTAKNRVQWGPIIAGVLSAIAVLLILTILGLAVGSSALKPRNVGQAVGTGAAIWGIISALIAFFVGGWVAAKTAAVGGVGSGLINGLMVGCTILAIILYLTGTGIGSAIGLLGTNLGDLTNVAQNAGINVSSDNAQQQAQQVDPQQAFNAVKNGAWGTLAGIVIPLAAAALGGLLGHNTRRDIVDAA